jgi:serine/threonine-protein kinase RsbW
MKAINHAAAEVLRVAKRVGCLGDGKAEMEIALREALANAVIHGNKSAAEKTVLLRCYCDPERGLLIAIRDEGKGFLPDEVPDPRAAERVHLTHGRGIFLMRELMDHVEHRKGGREVLLYKKTPVKAPRKRRTAGSRG